MVYSMSMTGQRPAYAGLLFSRPTAKAKPKSGQRGGTALKAQDLKRIDIAFRVINHLRK